MVTHAMIEAAIEAYAAYGDDGSHYPEHRTNLVRALRKVAPMIAVSAIEGYKRFEK
jgi:hypothetical protein